MDKKSTNQLLKLLTQNTIDKIILSQEEIAHLFKKRSAAIERFVNEILTSDENFFNIFFYSITKFPRSPLEITIIIKYLNTLETFINLLKKSASGLKELSFSIGSSIKYEFLKKDHILFRLGDKGDKYFIILKGAISILIAKDVKMDLTEDEYLKYVIKLKSSHEVELLYKTLIHNNQVFPGVYETYYQKPLEKRRASRQLTNRNSLQTKIIINKDIEDVKEAVKMSVDEYISHNLPEFGPEKEKKERRSVTIFKYFNVVTLRAGDTFGEVALTSTSQKR